MCFTQSNSLKAHKLIHNGQYIIRIKFYYMFISVPMKILKKRIELCLFCSSCLNHDKKMKFLMLTVEKMPKATVDRIIMFQVEILMILNTRGIYH